MKYKQLTFPRFSDAMLTTFDLDPVYVMLHDADLSRANLDKFCLAYWCFYHSGVAAYIASKPATRFWPLMQQAHDEKWPRGTERRHFRGDSSKNAIAYMRDFGTPHKVVRAMLKGDDYATVATNVKSFPFFGPWIAFKIADMKERCFHEPCSFPISSLDIFKDPTIGAAMVKMGPDTQFQNPALPQVEVHKVVRKYIKEFESYSAPPGLDRPVNAQEIETLLCKWKSHWRGHYMVGKDTIEIGVQLDDAECKFASDLKRSLPYERLDRWSRTVR